MHLAGIVRYPIKSCRGIEVPRALVERRGVVHDRRWMIVDGGGRFVTQREESRLSLVDVALDDDGAQLRLGAPNMHALTIPAAWDDGGRERVVVWRSEVEAIAHPAASEWMSRYLEREVRVVYMPDDVQRDVNPERGRPGDIVSFADGYPLLLATQESLDDLVARAGTPLAMSRFRPNVVIAGATPWAEDGWSTLRIGAIRFRAPKPCERCVVTTIDPTTGVAGKEPLKTLAKFRRVDGNVLFGINLIPDLEPGQRAPLAVGDAVVIE